MKILFLTDNYPPEMNAPANRTYEHCQEWRKLGASITVITTQPNFPRGEIFPGYRNRLYAVEEMDGVRVIRVWSYITSNSGFALRILDYLSYAFTAFFASLFVRADIIIATSPQFFTACSGALAGCLKRTPWIFEVRDLWPESIKAVGAMKDSLPIRLLERLELFLYRNAAQVVVVTEAFRKNIVARGILPEKIALIPNGVNREEIQQKGEEVRSEIAREISDLRATGKQVVGYIGTHGMAHGLDFILHQAKELQEQAEFSAVHFLFVGDGAEKKNLVALQKELQLTNITMHDAVPRDEAIAILAEVDIALIPLRRSKTFLTVLPSKIFESAALEKPILLGVNGEARKLVEHFHAGICYEPEEAPSFQRALKAILDSGEEWKKGGRTLATEYSRQRLAGEMYAICKELVER
ncbi:glycosyltransferase family 4 protein [bacterium]|nr:glycosyltransferase family 4 protein [bacterium]